MRGDIATSYHVVHDDMSWGLTELMAQLAAWQTRRVNGSEDRLAGSRHGAFGPWAGLRAPV